MKLRNNCTEHTRISRRALRLALAFALATGGGSSLHAGNSLTPPPRPLPSLGAAEAELLPYPFGGTGSSQPASEELVATKRTGVSRQLVKLLGLDRPTQLVETRQTQRENHPLAPPAGLPTLALPTATTPQLAAGAVVTASATEEHVPKAPEALPALPVAPSAPETGLSESLLDIEIPAGLAMMPSNAAECTTAKPTVTTSDKAEYKPAPCAVPALPNPEPSSGVIQACEPPALNPSEAVATKASAEPKMAESSATSLSARQPDIVRSPQAMNLKPPAAPKNSGGVSMNLNDSVPEGKATLTRKQNSPPSADSRGAVLHLSSASDEVKLSTPSAASKLPAMPTMTRTPRSAEQPAEPVLAKRSDAVASGLRPADPLSMQESSARSLQTRLATTGKTLGPVKAVLASRTTPVIPMYNKSGAGPSSSTAVGISPASASPVGTYPAETAARASSNALAVGLQESHTLSTDYTILELSVEHPDICQLLKTSDRSVSIIGMRPGATRIALISYDNQGERRVDVREIAVGDRAATAVNLSELAKEISQTVAHMYPKSDVQILADQDQIVVRGFTNYEHDAKKILALVRKTSLAPVVDQLTTSGN